MIKQLCAYGSLRQGGFRFDFLPRPKNVSAEIKLGNFIMYAFKEVGYPGVIESINPNNYIICNVFDFYNLSDKKWQLLLDQLDLIEGVDMGLFERKIIDTPNGKAHIYLFCHKRMLNSILGAYKKHNLSEPIITDWIKDI